MAGLILPDADGILKLISPSDYKSQVDQHCGRIAVIGGIYGDCGAPYFAAISALKLGATMSCVFCTKEAGPIIQTYSSELNVMPIMLESLTLGNDEFVALDVIEEVVDWVRCFDCLVIGPGLGGDHFLLYCVTEIMKQAKGAGIPMVIAGEGLNIVNNDPNLIQDYPFVVLSLDLIEFKLLAQTVLGVPIEDESVVEQLPCVSKGLGGVTIMLREKYDHISDGHEVYEMSMNKSARQNSQDANAHCGSIALFIAWARLRAANDALGPILLGCIAASAVFRRAGSLAFRRKKRSTLTTDIIENLGLSLEKLCPHEK